MEIQVKVETVRRMLMDEWEHMYEFAARELDDKSAPCDAIRNMLLLGYRQVMEKIRSAETFEDLDHAVYLAGYRMTLQQWLDSYH